MMRVLIVHDRNDAADAIEAVVKAALPDSIVHKAFNQNEARDHLSSQLYDFAIVDLTLPYTPYDKDPSLQAAEHLLAEMFDSPGLHAPGDILGISRDGEVLELVRTSIGEHLMGSLTEDGDGRWKTALTARLKYVEKARRARQAVTRASYDYDVVVLTALDKELAPYKELFELREARNGKAFNFTDRDGELRRGIAFSINQSGQAPAASAAQSLIEQYRPRLLLMTGFCGGIEKRTRLGDCLAIRTAFAWDYGKWEDQENSEGSSKPRFRPRPTPLNVLDEGVIETVRTMIDDNYAPGPDTLARVAELSGDAIAAWRTKSVAAGSGSAVVTSLDILAQITGLDETIWAVEMESYAVYRACRFTQVAKPDFLCVKSVADFCNGEKDSKFHEACSHISAAFARDLITRYYDFAKGLGGGVASR